MELLPCVLTAACTLLAGSALAQSGPAGHWEGSMQLPNREVQIILDFARSGEGWAGAFAQPEQNVRDVPVSDLKVAGNTVSFGLGAGGANAPSFSCTQEGADAMDCTVTSPGGSVTGRLKRTGEAKLNLPKPSPAVSKELEGDWQGIVETPGGSLRLDVHFQNQPDNTVKATLDSPDQNSKGLPVTDVAQSGPTVTFQLRVVNGAFKGTLDKEGKQLTGDWTQSGTAMPLTLKKVVK